MLKTLRKNLKTLLQKALKDNKPEEIEERPVSPYGAFLSENRSTAFFSNKFDVVFQRFQGGDLVTVLQDDSRKFSQFYPAQEQDWEDEEDLEYGEEDLEYGEEEEK